LARAYRRLLCHCLLWITAALLRCLSYPHRRWFHRLHGDAALSLTAVPAHGEGLARFTQRGPVWQSTEFEELVRNSNARWILWHEDGAVETAEDMLPLFDDERTFAVSRQVDYRGWKRQLAATAPFRALQPGEATRALAPVSRALLVDRRIPLDKRLSRFFTEYRGNIDRLNARLWTRAGLMGLHKAGNFSATLARRILGPMIRELRHEAGLPAKPTVTGKELEVAMVVHAAVAFPHTRSFIFGMDVHGSLPELVPMMVRVWLPGAKAELRRLSGK
jgi:hypothetical protein